MSLAISSLEQGARRAAKGAAGGSRARRKRRRPHQGHDDAGLPRRRARRLAQRARAGRFLGAVVRAVQAADAHPGKGRAPGRRQGAARQDEHRRAPADPRPARHPVDPRRHRLQERPAARRLHGRAAREPGAGLHRAPRRADRPERARRRRSRPPTEALAAKDYAGAAGLFSAVLPAEPDNVARARRPGALPYRARRARAGARPPRQRYAGSRRTTPAIAGARAALELAEQARQSRRSEDARAQARARPGRPPGALRPGARAQRPRRPRRRGPRSCSRSCGATAAWNEEAARKQLVQFFEAWGPKDPATAKGASACHPCFSPKLLAGLHRERCWPWPSWLGTGATSGRTICPASIPVFPLSGALLLPNGQMPLNIFEPRYLAMVDAALGRRPPDRHDPAGARRGRDAARPGALRDRLRRPHHRSSPRPATAATSITLSGVSRFAVVEEVEAPARPTASAASPPSAFPTTSSRSKGEEAVDRAALAANLPRLSRRERAGGRLGERRTRLQCRPRDGALDDEPVGAGREAGAARSARPQARASTLIAITEIALAGGEREAARACNEETVMAEREERAAAARRSQASGDPRLPGDEDDARIRSRAAGTHQPRRPPRLSDPRRHPDPAGGGGAAPGRVRPRSGSDVPGPKEMRNGIPPARPLRPESLGAHAWAR